MQSTSAPSELPASLAGSPPTASRRASKFLEVGLMLAMVSFMGFSTDPGDRYSLVSEYATYKFGLQLAAGAMFMVAAIAHGQKVRFDCHVALVATLLLTYTVGTIYHVASGQADSDVVIARLASLYMCLPLIWALQGSPLRDGQEGLIRAMLLPLAIVVALAWTGNGLAERVVYLDGEIQTSRLGGNVIPPNEVGLMAAACIILLIHSSWQKHSKLIIGACLIAILLLSQSRSAMIALVACLIISHAAKRPAGTIFVNLAAAAILAVGASFSIDLLSSLVSERMTVGLATAGGRVELWAGALDLYWDADAVEMVFGYGPMMVGKWLVLSSGLVTQSAHNSVLQLLLCAGLIGVLVYLALFWSALRVGLRKEPSAIILLQLAIFLFVVGMSELGVGTKLNQATVLFALVLAQPCRRTISPMASR